MPINTYKLVLTTVCTVVMMFSYGQTMPIAPISWQRADSVETNVLWWRDVSGHGYHAIPSSGNLSDSLTLMNFNPCFYLDGTDWFNVSFDSLSTDSPSAIVVYEAADDTSDYGLWDLRIDSSSRVGLTSLRILNDHGRITYDSLNRRHAEVNYLGQAWDEEAVPNHPTLRFGIADTMPLHGKLAEFMFFDQHLPDSDCVQWISYMAVKYGITLYGTNYLDSRRRCVWNHDAYPNYSYSIAGLGRDDSLGLYQKQTFFADRQIVFGLDSLVERNGLSFSQLNDGDFMIMGMDSNAFWMPTTLYLSNGEEFDSYGHGIIQMTGEETPYHHTFVRLQTEAFTADSVQPALVIDRSGSGSYDISDIEFFYPDRIDSNHVYWFSELNWDPDGNGTDAFCFAVTPYETVQGTTMSCASPTSPQGSPETSTSGNHKTEEAASSQLPDYLLYPNPNSGKFVVEINYPVEQDVVVTVYAADGKKVLDMNGKGQRQYRLEGWTETSGHYLIDIVSELERKTLKMVVNR